MNNTTLTRLGYFIIGVLMLIASFAIITNVLQAASPLHSIFASTIFGTAGIIILFGAATYNPNKR